MSFTVPSSPGAPPPPPLSPEERARKDEERNYLRKGLDPVLSRSLGEEYGKVERRAPAPHLTLDNMVVAKAAQGKGVGTLLLQTLLDRADSAKLPIFCMSSDEVRPHFRFASLHRQ
jgi:GNAT superfamily N-acetyltransferase